MPKNYIREYYAQDLATYKSISESDEYSFCPRILFAFEKQNARSKFNDSTSFFLLEYAYEKIGQVLYSHYRMLSDLWISDNIERLDRCHTPGHHCIPLAMIELYEKQAMKKITGRQIEKRDTYIIEVLGNRIERNSIDDVSVDDIIQTINEDRDCTSMRLQRKLMQRDENIDLQMQL